MTNSKLYTWGIVLVLSALIVSGCGADTVEPTVGLANPASVYCEGQGYTLEMRTDADGGTYGVCIFPDGSECEEWTFYRGECSPASIAETATETPPPEIEQPTPVPTTVPTEAIVEVPDAVNDEWLVYVNDVYGYQFSYPASATITEQGVTGFASDELPEGMSVDDYMAQLQETYTDKLCVSVCYELGCVNISAPPNTIGRYNHCGRTGVGYEIVDKSETVVIGGQSYTAEGLEEVGPGETLNYHNETLWLTLPDDTVIEYGAVLLDETATYEDYLQTTKDVLLQIVTSYEQIPATNPPKVGQEGQDEEWLVYTNDHYGYQFSYPASATITEIGPQSFSTDELPEGMSAEQYLVQLEEMYGNKLCVSVHTELGYVYISVPPNSEARYAMCGRTGAAYELTDKSEIVVIDGQTYTATGFEEIGPGEILPYHNETLRVMLADGTMIEYGAVPNETATYEDYLQTTRDILLQIVTSYEQIPATNPPPAMQ